MSKQKYSENFIRLASLLQAAAEIPGISVMINNHDLFGRFIDGMNSTDRMELITMSMDEKGNSLIKFLEETE